MKCVICNRQPHEIEEYVELAEMLNLAPSIAVEQEDGTYDAETNYFCCTECYMNIGNPTQKQLFKLYRVSKKREDEKNGR